MTTVIDTNILVALWDADGAQSRGAQAALDAALDRGGLVIPAPVFSELMALRRTEAFLEQFLRDTGIALDWRIAEAVWREAGRAFGVYALRRRRHGDPGPRRILADFLIGAYAAHHGFELLTLDRGLYRAIPGIKLVVA